MSVIDIDGIEYKYMSVYQEELKHKEYLTILQAAITVIMTFLVLLAMAVITSPERIDVGTISLIGLVSVMGMIITVLLIHFLGLKPLQEKIPKRKGQAWSIILIIIIFLILIFLLVTYGSLPASRTTP
ncbi:MAG: hypothetical protein JXC85_06210 [Candidatus Aenigmarchaeota archaeon]|nr:hypothetical protein [Candidatus Aenigmarchaeota archaeon]